MTLADVYDVQPTQAVSDDVDGPISASDRSPLGRELARWSSRNSSKGALLLESVRSYASRRALSACLSYAAMWRTTSP
jgi:hypothetical protein